MDLAELGLLVLGRQPAPDFVERARWAEELGFDVLWYADERFFRDCWASLAFAAAHTARLRLGVCVTDPYVRHPALTAAAAATLDEISGGRHVLGLGAGISGFEAMGVERKRPMTAMREAIGLIRALWSGETMYLDGEVIRFHGGLDFDARADIPVMVATNGPRMLELAGELADMVMVQGMASPTMVSSVRHRVAEGARRAGRDPGSVGLIARVDVCISDRDPDAARGRMRSGLVRHLATHHPRYESFRLAGVEIPEDLAAAVSDIGYRHDRVPELEARIPDEWIDRFCLAGTTDQVTEATARLLGQGISGLTLMPMSLPGGDPDATAETFVSEVLPAARREASVAGD